MKTILNAAKAVILLTALAIVGLSAIPGDAEAVTCETTAHTCHAIIGGTTYHLKVIYAY